MIYKILVWSSNVCLHVRENIFLNTFDRLSKNREEEEEEENEQH